MYVAFCTSLTFLYSCFIIEIQSLLESFQLALQMAIENEEMYRVLNSEKVGKSSDPLPQSDLFNGLLSF